MSLLIALINKSSHILAGIYFAFLKNRPRPNAKAFQYQIWTSKRLKRELSMRTNFSNFFEFNCSNFRLKLVQMA